MTQNETTPAVFPFTVAFIIPLSVFAGGYVGIGHVWLTPFIAFVMIPVLDLGLGINRSNPPEAQEGSLSEAVGFRLITLAALPLQAAVLGMGLWMASTGELSTMTWLGLAFSVGISGGAMGITVAHELVHRFNRMERWWGYALLSMVLYMHWAIEHVSGHHLHVSTPGDPASARKEEALYPFLLRSVFGSIGSAWRIEAAFMARKQRSTWSPSNRILIFVAIQGTLVALIGGLLGPGPLAFFLVQAVVAFLLLEIINYIEHYGLERKKIDGRYERVTPQHSWNASQRLTNYFLFHLQRHSDHHARPERRYQLLRHFDESPQLPTGYAGMLLLALVPPLWKKVMDPRIPAR